MSDQPLPINPTPLQRAFEECLELVRSKYGAHFHTHPEWVGSEAARYMERLAELVREESGIEILFNPQLN